MNKQKVQGLQEKHNGVKKKDSFMKLARYALVRRHKHELRMRAELFREKKLVKNVVQGLLKNKQEQ